MSKSFRPGHSFPTSAGFTGSSGKTQQISGYSRAVPKRAVGKVMGAGKFAATNIPKPGAPQAKPKLGAPGIPAPLGHSLTHRAKPVTQEDALHGGKSPLLAGYKRGGMVKGKC